MNIITDIGLEQLFATVGSGAVLGGVAGFAAKKLLKFAIFLVILEAGLVMFLEKKGILNVYWENMDGVLSNSGSSGEEIGAGISSLQSLVGALPITAGIAAGFLVGFKIG